MSFRTSNSAVPLPQPPSQNLYSEQSFDSSMVLIVLVLLSGLFFMGFFSIYIRRFSADPVPDYASQTRRRLLRADVRLQRKGVEPEVIGSLPVYSYCRGKANKYELLECAICLGEFEEKEIVKMIPYCKHVFHFECIGTWLKMHVTCPLCRDTRLFEENNSEGGGGDGGSVGGARPDTVEGDGNEQNRISTVENVDTCIQVGEVSLMSSGGSSIS